MDVEDLCAGFSEEEKDESGEEEHLSLLADLLTEEEEPESRRFEVEQQADSCEDNDYSRIMESSGRRGDEERDGSMAIMKGTY